MADTAVQRAAALPRKVIDKGLLYLGSIRVWETLYALPFAYMGMVLAADGWPGWSAFIWITAAMAGARTLGMSANRLIHRKEDIANPRTAGRHLPGGLMKPREVLAIVAVSAGVFFFAASQLNILALILAPMAGAYIILYSFTKYQTWGCHFFLGWALGIAPSAAWLGVAGRLEPEPVLLSFAVAAWAAGFDIIYGCADFDFDREYGVHSIPSRFGIATALWVSRGLHLCSGIALLVGGLWLGLNGYYYIGWGLAMVLLTLENSMVRADNLASLHSPFFKYNSAISMVLLAFTVLAVTL